MIITIELQLAEILSRVMLRAAMTTDSFQALMVRLQVGRAA